MESFAISPGLLQTLLADDDNHVLVNLLPPDLALAIRHQVRPALGVVANVYEVYIDPAIIVDYLANSEWQAWVHEALQDGDFYDQDADDLGLDDRRDLPSVNDLLRDFGVRVDLPVPSHSKPLDPLPLLVMAEAILRAYMGSNLLSVWDVLFRELNLYRSLDGVGMTNRILGLATILVILVLEQFNEAVAATFSDAAAASDGNLMVARSAPGSEDPSSDEHESQEGDIENSHVNSNDTNQPNGNNGSTKSFGRFDQGVQADQLDKPAVRSSAVQAPTRTRATPSPKGSKRQATATDPKTVLPTLIDIDEIIRLIGWVTNASSNHYANGSSLLNFLRPPQSLITILGLLGLDNLERLSRSNRALPNRQDQIDQSMGLPKTFWGYNFIDTEAQSVIEVVWNDGPIVDREFVPTNRLRIDLTPIAGSIKSQFQEIVTPLIASTNTTPNITVIDSNRQPNDLTRPSFNSDGDPRTNPGDLWLPLLPIELPIEQPTRDRLPIVDSPAIAFTLPNTNPSWVLNDPSVIVSYPSINNDPVINLPVVNSPTANNPIVDSPIVNDLIVNPPTVNNPTVNRPVIDKPIVNTPTINNPIVNNSTVNEPTVNNPIVNRPVVDNPIVQDPSPIVTLPNPVNPPVVINLPTIVDNTPQPQPQPFPQIEQPKPSEPKPPFNDSTFIVDSSGQVTIDFLYDHGFYEGELAIVNLTGMEQFVGNSTAFIQEVLRRASSQSDLGYIVISDRTEGAKYGTWDPANDDFNTGAYLGMKTFQMKPGIQFGLVLIPNSTVKEVSNRTNLADDQQPIFSFGANGSILFGQSQFAEVTPSNVQKKQIVIEDMAGSRSDRDYNDLVVQIGGVASGTTGLNLLNASLGLPQSNWCTNLQSDFDRYPSNPKNIIY